MRPGHRGRPTRCGDFLTQFADYLAAHGAATLTIEHALAWATSPSSADPRWWAARLSTVRGFAVYLHSLDPVHQVPPGGLIPHGSRRTVPYLYTSTEIAALVRAAGNLSFPLRAATYQTLIRLLAVTGMRAGEAIRLDREGWDAGLGVLTVHHAKFGKSRQLPLHSTATAGLQDYLRLRDRLMPHPHTGALLLSTKGFRLRYERVWDTFHQLTGQAGLTARSPACTPRIHDLRPFRGHHPPELVPRRRRRAGDAAAPVDLPRSRRSQAHLLVLLRFPGYSDTRSLARVMGL